MRTTLTIDDDLAVRLKALAEQRGVGLKTVVNDALRRGLGAGSGDPPPHQMPTTPMQLLPGIDLTRATALAGDLEDAEIARRLELRP